MTRVRITVLFAALALLASFAVACGGGDEQEEPSGPLSNANLEALKSGVVDFSLSARSGGAQSGSAEVRVSGPFQAQGKNLPKAHLTASVKGGSGDEDVDFQGSVTLLGDRGFLEYNGARYNIDPEYFGFGLGGLLPRKPGTNKETGPPAISACIEAATALDVEGLARKLTSEKGGRVDGTPVTKVTGDLDPGRAIAAIQQLADNPSCRAQLKVAGKPGEMLEKAVDQLAGTVEKAHVEAYIGEDGIVRRIVGELKAEPKGGAQNRVEVEFALTLSKVNEDPRIPVPRGGQPILSWLETLGLDQYGAFFVFGEKTALGTLLELVADDLAAQP